ncbi:hypothetical protein [Nostoc phage YongM]|nr:hypothetical protein [Nostoc phage YongM]
MTRLTVKSVTEYAQTHGYELEIKNGCKDKYTLKGVNDDCVVITLTFSYKTLNEVMLAINEGWLLDGQCEPVEFEVVNYIDSYIFEGEATIDVYENSCLQSTEKLFVIHQYEENYLNDSGEKPTFQEVATAIAPYGYELHRNNGQFFTESKAPYIYFKSGESEYALHVTYFLDSIVESVEEIYHFKINNQRFQQIAYELSKTSDHAGENLTGNETLSDRLSMLEKRLINAVEQRRANVRQICSDIGKMVREWSSGQGFGFANTVKRVTRKVARHAKKFYTMLTNRVLVKYAV